MITFKIYPQGTPEEHFRVIIYPDYSQFFRCAQRAYGKKLNTEDNPLGSFTWHPDNQCGHMGTLRFPDSSLARPGIIAHEIEHAAMHFYLMREDDLIWTKKEETIIIHPEREEIKATINEFLTDSFYEKLETNKLSPRGHKE